MNEKAAPKKRPLATKRAVDTSKSEAIADPREKLRALNAQLQTLHYSHNEARRLGPLVIDQLVKVVLGDAPEKVETPSEGE